MILEAILSVRLSKCSRMNASLFSLISLSLATFGCAHVPQTATGVPIASEHGEWEDPAPHRTGYVTGGDARLHYLDFGGRGEDVVFLPGLGSSAHAFDEIAPGLTDRFRVIGLTPRAHGESSTPDTTYTVTDAAEDLRVLMDSLGIAKAHLVGHSISGATITRFAALHPHRVGKLIYLDATFDYGGPEEAAVDEAVLPRPWPEDGMTSVDEYRDWARRYFYGVWSTALEADMRAGATAPEEEHRRRTIAHAALLEDVIAHPQEYAEVRAPALAIWAEKTMDTHYFWVNPADTHAVSQAEEYLRLRRLWEQNGVIRFQREMPEGRVLSFPAHHWLFVTDEAQVLHEMRSFLDSR